jgi:hypothetical protein
LASVVYRGSSARLRLPDEGIVLPRGEEVEVSEEVAERLRSSEQEVEIDGEALGGPDDAYKRRHLETLLELAAENDLELPDDASREEVIEVLEGAGVKPPNA